MNRRVLLMESLNILVLILFVLFYLLFIGRSIILACRGINPLVLGKGKKGFNRYLELLFLIVLVFWTFENINAAFGYPVGVLPELLQRPLFANVYLKSGGCLAMVLGLILFGWALFSFGASWRIGIDNQNPGELVTSGVFGFTRNPIFLAVDLYFLGSFLSFGNWFFLVSAVAALAGIHYQILQEEKFLSQQYGATYRNYQQRVRRYL